MRFIAVVVLALSAPAYGADRPCLEQDYSDPKKAPDFRCQGPGEAAMIPDVPSRGSLGLEPGTEVFMPKVRKKLKLDYEAVLMDKSKVLELGLKIKGLRRLRWIDLNKGKELLEVERKYVADKMQAKLDLEKSRVKTLKTQRDEAREQRDRARAWYRSWSFGLVVGIVTTAAAAGTLIYVADRLGES